MYVGRIYIYLTRNFVVHLILIADFDLINYMITTLNNDPDIIDKMLMIKLNYINKTVLIYTNRHVININTLFKI